MLKMSVSLITVPYISRVLGPEGTGRYSYANSIAAYFVMFAMLGINSYGNRSIAMIRDDKEELSKKFLSIYSLQLILSIIMIVFYITYIRFICDDTIMGWIMLLYVLSAALDVNWFFAGLENFKLIAIRNTIVQILTVILIFSCVRKKDDIYIYAFIYAAGIIVQQIALWKYIPKHISFKKISYKDIAVHFKPVLILFIPIFALSVYKFIDKIMLGWFSTKMEVGYYEACDGICAIPSAMIVSLGNVMLPKMSNLFAKKQDEKSKEYISKSIILAVFLASSISFGIMSVSKEFVPIYYGSGFEKCIEIYKYLLLCNIFIALENVIRVQYLIPRKYDKVFVTSFLLGAVVNIVLNLLLIHKYASIGVAVATLISRAAVCTYQFIAIRKELPINKYLVQSIPFIIAGIVMYFILINIAIPVEMDILKIAVKVVMGVLIYFVVLLCGLLLSKNYFKNIFNFKNH